jgi:hypothetical protein
MEMTLLDSYDICEMKNKKDIKCCVAQNWLWLGF